MKENGSKLGQEDFATLSGKTKDNAGANFKYEYSYEEAGQLIQKFVPAWGIEIEKYFSLVVFNFLFSNGEVHLKNFSLLESSSGDYLLSPAYDLVNTKLHGGVNDFALDKGLFSDRYKSEQYKKSGHPYKRDFTEKESFNSSMRLKYEEVMGARTASSSYQKWRFNSQIKL